MGHLRRYAALYVETFHLEAARPRLAVVCPYIPPSRIAEFEGIGVTCFRFMATCSIRVRQELSLGRWAALSWCGVAV
jgi:hypothetical protein